jgi:hypothetical protein
MANAFYAVDGTLGAKLTEASTTPTHALGQLVQANAGAVFMYVRASSTISQYDCAVADSSYKANAITSSLVTEGASIGWPQVSAVADDYLWMALQGRTINIRVASSAAANAALYTTATAGVLDDAAANNLIEGVKVVTTQASTTGLAGTPAYAIYARVGASV